VKAPALILRSPAVIVYLSLLFFCHKWGFSQDFKLKTLKINHKPATTENLKFPSLYNDVFIEFEPGADSRTVYKYILSGYELDTTITAYPSARYMKLGEGDYTFEITAWSPEGQLLSKYTLPLQVYPSIAETWWFYPVLILCGVLMVIGGVYLFFLYNFRQKLKIQKLRNRLSSDLHDEVGATLSSIAIASHLVNKKIKNEDPELRRILEQIKNDSEETVMSIRDTAWALNPENESLYTLLEKIRSFGLQILSKKEIQLTFNSNVTPDNRAAFSIENQKNLYLILKEVINNIARHSEATAAEIAVTCKQDKLNIRVSENGKGFDTREPQEGNGLKNIMTRAGESYFDIKIESAPGQGTQIEIEALVF